MNRAEKEQYLREYEVLKKQGKPFFPYAVLKDSTMFFIVVAVAVAMSLILGAEQGPRADPTTTSYVPRPEWYFFFLFELLIIIKPPELVPLATVGIPTIAMVLLLLLPFYDRNPERRPERRPVAATAGILTIVAMAFLTYHGAVAGSPTEIDMEAIDVSPQHELGAQLVVENGCLGCHQIGENGNEIAPDLTHIGATLPAQGIERTLLNPADIMPSYEELPPEDLEEIVSFLASLQ
jgi:menaquinol-cytochrome c reductase cytochrome b/c subunit